MTKFCMSVDIRDVITCAPFCDDRLTGLGVARGRISRFPIDLRRRPYNTLALPCECVMHVVFRSLLKIFEYAAKQACKQLQCNKAKLPQPASINGLHIGP